MKIICLLLLLSIAVLELPFQVMSLTNLHKISCRILNRAGCNCNTFTIPTTVYCQPSSISTIQNDPNSDIINGNGVGKTARRKKSTLIMKSKNIMNVDINSSNNAGYANGNISGSGGNGNINMINRRKPKQIISNSRLFSIKEDTTEKGKETETTMPIQDESMKSKIKALWKNYGTIAIGTYLGVYLTTLGSIFIAIDFDIFNAGSVGLDPAYAIKKFCDLMELLTRSSALPNYIEEHPRVGTFAIAWVMTKFTEPLRLGFTLLTVPSVARFFGRVPFKSEATVIPKK